MDLLLWLSPPGIPVCPSLPQNLGGELDRTLTLAGEAVVQMSTNMATALKAAQEAVDQVLPGPNLQQVLVDLR